MPHLIFKLNSVPDDEADDIRNLLDEQEIEFYETDSGRFGLGFAAIWLKNDDKLEKAKSSIEKYQKQRCMRVRSEHDAEKLSGERISRFNYFKSSPIRFSLLIVFAALLAYFTVIPFFK